MANTAPVVTINDHSVSMLAWNQISGWSSYLDADGNPAIKYQFWDGGIGANSGFIWNDAGSGQLAANTTLEINAADLSQIWVRGGSAGGSETMWMRAFDGTDWGAWDSFTLTTIPNSPPVATISDQSLRVNDWARVSNWIAYSDADGEAATRYQFWDGGTSTTSGYFWNDAGSGRLAANTTLDVTAADLNKIWVRAGSVSGSETLWVRAFDGHDWGAWDSFTLTSQPNTAPVAGIADQSLHVDGWARASNLLSYSDADGDAATQYQFWDGGTGSTSACIWSDIGGGQQAPSTAITVAASDVSKIWIHGGSTTGSDTMYVRAFDGHDWSAWDSFTVTSQNAAPDATIDDHSVHLNQWVRASNWLSSSDPDGDTVTQYQFWDGGTATTSGFIWNDASTGQQASSTAITVAAGDVSKIWLHGGSATGTETMYVRAFDGHSWGAWDSFSFATVTNTAPVADITDHTLHVNEWARVSNWLTSSDAEGDAVTRYQFWDGGAAGSSGYFWNDAGTGQQPASTALEVAASDVSQLWVRGGGRAWRGNHVRPRFRWHRVGRLGRFHADDGRVRLRFGRGLQISRLRDEVEEFGRDTGPCHPVRSAATRSEFCPVPTPIDCASAFARGHSPRASWGRSWLHAALRQTCGRWNLVTPGGSASKWMVPPRSVTPMSPASGPAGKRFTAGSTSCGWPWSTTKTNMAPLRQSATAMITRSMMSGNAPVANPMPAGAQHRISSITGNTPACCQPAASARRTSDKSFNNTASAVRPFKQQPHAWEPPRLVRGSLQPAPLLASRRAVSPSVHRNPQPVSWAARPNNRTSRFSFWDFLLRGRIRRLITSEAREVPRLGAGIEDQV